jgi:hypothetical protein
MMEGMRASETSVLTKATRRHIPEDGILYCHRSENLRSYIYSTVTQIINFIPVEDPVYTLLLL